MARFLNQPGQAVQWLLSLPAAAYNEAARWDQVQALYSGLAESDHDHSAGSITDFSGAVFTAAEAFLTDGDTVQFVSASGQITAEVIRKPGGYIETGPDGLFADVSSSGLALKSDVTGAQHAAVTVLDSSTVTFGLVGQQVTAAVAVAAGRGILATTSGLLGDTSVLSPAGHTHAQLHDAVTVVATDSITALLSGQQLTVSAKLDVVETLTRRPVRSHPTGLYTDVNTSGTDHTHDAATEFAAGFLSAADQAKLNRLSDQLAADQVVTFHRHDQIMADEYVGGRMRFGQSMQILSADLTAAGAPAVAYVALEIDGAVYDTIQIPAGTDFAAVASYTTFSDLVVPAGELLRVVMTSGMDDVTQAPARVDVAVRLIPSSLTAVTVRVNAGGDAVGVWAEDDYYDGGASSGDTTHAIDLGGVSDPAPEAVYQSARHQNFNASPLNYVIPGLARGVDYLVRLHFAEQYWSSAGEDVFHIHVRGATTASTEDFDIIAEAGAKWKAVVVEHTLKADTNGEIRVQLVPQVNGLGVFFAAISGIELVPL